MARRDCAELTTTHIEGKLFAHGRLRPHLVAIYLLSLSYLMLRQFLSLIHLGLTLRLLPLILGGLIITVGSFLQDVLKNLLFRRWSLGFVIIVAIGALFLRLNLQQR